MKNSIVVENNFLFLDIAQAIHHLNERASRYEQGKCLMAVLTDEVMSVSKEIGKACGIDQVILFDGETSRINSSSNNVEFDLNVVKDSGRDIPQDFIFHEERNLKAKMISSYEPIYNELSSKYPNQEIILI